MFMESFTSGAFDKSISESARALPLLAFHDSSSFPIGVAESWTTESDGLYGVWRMDDSDTAREAVRQAEAGILTGLSIGFQPVRSAWSWLEETDDLDAPVAEVVRSEARLVEVSMVPTPQYENAMVTLVRSVGAPRRLAQGTPRLDAMRKAFAAFR
jgi:HK97 family phage prohead protease